MGLFCWRQTHSDDGEDVGLGDVVATVAVVVLVVEFAWGRQCGHLRAGSDGGSRVTSTVAIV